MYGASNEIFKMWGIGITIFSILVILMGVYMYRSNKNPEMHTKIAKWFGVLIVLIGISILPIALWVYTIK